MNAVDTNILLYSIDQNEPAKQIAAQQLLQRLRSETQPTILLWQVLGEFTQQLRRWRDQGRLTSTEFSQHIEAFRHLFPLVLPAPEAFDLALHLAEQYSLSHWDSHDPGRLPGGGGGATLHGGYGCAAPDWRHRVD